MLAALLKAAVALVLMVRLFSATQLVAAWAVKIALVLAIAKAIARRGFRFRLVDMLAATAFCAVLLAALRSIEINRYLPDLNMLALLSILSSITIAALWAALSPARPAQRVVALAPVLCTSAAMIRFGPYFDLSYMRSITEFLRVLLALTTHALIVIKAARVWRMWETATARPIDS